VRVAVYDAALFEQLGDVWKGASDRQRLFVPRLLDPESVSTRHNTACRGQHELVVDHLDREQSPSGRAASYLAVGDDNATSPAYDDTALNNEVYRTSVTDSNDDGTALELTTFLDSTEANGHTLREVGLFTADVGEGADGGDGLLLNHSLVDPVEKTSANALTITVRLTYSAA
jgi:hypothetical protein